MHAGNESLFRELAVHDQWDWSRRHPVVRPGFAKGNFNASGYLHTNTMVQLERIARRAGVPAAYDTAPERFGDLIETLHESTDQRAVVLVDEYHKPILDALGDPAIAERQPGLSARPVRHDQGLRRACLEELRDGHLPVSEDEPVLRQFTGLTLDSLYNAVCGSTDDESD